jgi:hypothetical protein
VLVASHQLWYDDSLNHTTLAGRVLRSYGPAVVHQRGGPLIRLAARPFTVVSTAGVAAALVFAQIPTAAASASTTFVPGGATAISQALQIAPRDGGLSATVTVGQSIADYRDSLAQASSQALDLGLIGSTLAIQCNAAPPVLTAGELPKPITAESDTGATSSGKDTAGPDGNSASAATGRESVSASPAPNETATATFDGERLALPGVLTVAGLSSQSSARLIPGKARIATATADLGSLNLLGGKVALSGLHWSISLRSGSHPSLSRSFTLGSASLAGVALPTTQSSLGSTLAAVNKALTKTGLHISLPSLTDQDGVLGISPLSIGIDNSELGSEIVNPILNLVHSIADPAAGELTKALCQIGSVYSLVNLFLTGLNGVGALDVELGGATATSNDTTYSDPFGSGGLGNTTLPSTGTLPGSGNTGAGNGPVPTLPTTTATVGPSSETPQVAGTRALSSDCATTSPAGRPSCSKGAGLVVGLIALATLGGVAGADFLVSRRRRKLASMAIEI